MPIDGGPLLQPSIQVPDRGLNRSSSVSPTPSMTQRSGVCAFLKTGSNWLYAGIFFSMAASVVVLGVLLVHSPPGPKTKIPEFQATVQTKLGSVTGTILQDGTRQFLGIPYADVGTRPPYKCAGRVEPTRVGDEFVCPNGEAPHGKRFSPARTVYPWCTPCDRERHPAGCQTNIRCVGPPVKGGGTIDATRPAPPCMQACIASMPHCNATGVANHSVIGVEDCLTLNIYTPSKRASDALKGYPVMVWIHGGGFMHGSADMYNGSTLAVGDPNSQVIVVSINYRLGYFGFYQDEALKGGPEADRSWPALGGMNGVHDQIVALRWVKEHIHEFGGDHERVTIFGSEAGGQSVCTLLISPWSRDLFRCDADVSAFLRGSFCMGVARVSRFPVTTVRWKRLGQSCDRRVRPMHRCWRAHAHEGLQLQLHQADPDGITDLCPSHCGRTPLGAATAVLASQCHRSGAGARPRDG
eukprot:SAG25_NODE_91_length_16078_cov_7.663058_5_plen_468_part_00